MYRSSDSIEDICLFYCPEIRNTAELLQEGFNRNPPAGICTSGVSGAHVRGIVILGTSPGSPRNEGGEEKWKDLLLAGLCAWMAPQPLVQLGSYLLFMPGFRTS